MRGQQARRKHSSGCSRPQPRNAEPVGRWPASLPGLGQPAHAGRKIVCQGRRLQGIEGLDHPVVLLEQPAAIGAGIGMRLERPEVFRVQGIGQS